MLAPVFDNGLALIGEPDKYVTMADRRFTAIEPTDDAVAVTLAGAPGEHVSVLVYDADAGAMLPAASVALDATGAARLSIGR